jgi:hypothetical protein
LEKKRKAEEEIERSATEAPIEPLQPASEAKVRAQRFLTVMNSEQIFQLMLDMYFPFHFSIFSTPPCYSAEQIPEALEKIEEKAQSDPAHRKLFIRGLAWETTDEQLKSAFLSYGEIEDAAVVMDRTMAGKNKGYGFVIFKDMDAAYAALQEPEKEIDVCPHLPFCHSVLRLVFSRDARLTATLLHWEVREHYLEDAQDLLAVLFLRLGLHLRKMIVPLSSGLRSLLLLKIPFVIPPLPSALQKVISPWLRLHYDSRRASSHLRRVRRDRRVRHPNRERLGQEQVSCSLSPSLVVLFSEL